MREIRVHGQSKRYVHTRVGVGGRMDTLQCAIVLAKLEQFDWEIDQRIKIGNQYNKLLSNKIKTVKQKTDRTSVFAQYTVLVENREKVQAALKKQGIPSAVHYPIPINTQSPYKDFCCPECCSEALKVAADVISLPLHPYLSQSDQNFIVEHLLA